MATPRLLLRYTSLIEGGLRGALAGDSFLYAILRYHVGLEDEHGAPFLALGKLIRPSLVLFTTEKLGGDIEHSLPAAIGLELVHNFSLIHDDIQDHDEVRRGRKTVWSLYGIAQAINAGDLMQALAVAQGAHAGEEIVAALVEATVTMIEGQGLDLAFEEKKVKEIDVASYLDMIDKKTGALISCAFRMGGLLARSLSDVVQDLVALGQDLGRAFQIRDDLLGIWGNGTVTGKPQGSDIRRRKKSLPVAVAFAQACTEDRDSLAEIYSKEEIEDEDVERVIAFMEQANVRQACEEQLSVHLERARARLAALPLSERGIEEMNELIDYLARRKR
jgi:geranylgeranyl diphosphate synthase type I